MLAVWREGPQAHWGTLSLALGRCPYPNLPPALLGEGQCGGRKHEQSCQATGGINGGGGGVGLLRTLV